MPLIISPPERLDSRLVLTTAAFDPHFPDFDEAVLAIALAAEAARNGWAVDILALTITADLIPRLGATLEVLGRFGIGFRLVHSDPAAQARAAALSAAIHRDLSAS